MPIYTDEISIYNADAIGQAIGDSRDYYITEVSGDGIWVTPHDARPSNGQATSTTRGWHIADALEYFRGTVRYIKAWLNGTVPTVRLGQDTAGHTDVTPDGLEVFTDASTSVASFGETSRIGESNGTHIDISNGEITMSTAIGEALDISLLNGTRSGTNYSYPIIKASNAESGVSFMPTQVSASGANVGTDVNVAGNQLSVRGNTSYGSDTTSLINASVLDGSSTAESCFNVGYTGVYGASVEVGHPPSPRSGNTALIVSDGDNCVMQTRWSGSTVLGKYSTVTPSDSTDLYALAVGNGTSVSARSNAFAVKWDGTVELASPLPVASGGTGCTDHGSVTSSMGDMKSTSSASFVQLHSVSLAAGKYMVSIGCYAANNTSGVRQFIFTSATSVSGPSFVTTGGASMVRSPSPSGFAFYDTMTAYVAPTTTTTYRVFGYQNSGSSLNMRAYVWAVKIG